jgi:hypothetical protein
VYTIYGAPTPICTGAHKYLATALICSESKYPYKTKHFIYNYYIQIY